MKKLLISFLTAVSALTANAQLVSSGITVKNAQGNTLGVYNLRAVDDNMASFVIQPVNGGRSIATVINCRSVKVAMEPAMVFQPIANQTVQVLYHEVCPLLAQGRLNASVSFQASMPPSALPAKTPAPEPNAGKSQFAAQLEANQMLNNWTRLLWRNRSEVTYTLSPENPNTKTKEFLKARMHILDAADAALTRAKLQLKEHPEAARSEKVASVVKLLDKNLVVFEDFFSKASANNTVSYMSFEDIEGLTEFFNDFTKACR
jgi:hypothetical protein